MQELRQLKTSDLDPNPRQPRKRFDEEKLKEMAESLKHAGLLQPIIVRKNGARYQIIAGERRWRAAKLAGLTDVPVLVRDTADKKVLLESFIENIHREDLTSIEREDAVFELWESGQYASQRDLARTLGYRAETLTDIIEAKKFRNRVSALPDSITTTQIAQTQGLDDSTRVKVLEKVENGELKQVSSQVELRDAVQVLKKAPEPLRKAFEKGEVNLDRAKEAVNFYEQIKRDGNRVDERKVAQYVEELKKEEVDEARRDQERRDLLREVLTGQTVINSVAPESPRFWGEELETDPAPIQVANWWKWNLARAGSKFDFFTTHYSQKDIPTFIQVLKTAGVKTLVDVRHNPVSQFRPEFSKENLMNALKSNGIHYVHIPQLGVPREQRDKLAGGSDWKAFFNWYDSNIITKLKDIMNVPSLKQASKPYAFLCVEIDPMKCHRHRIAVAFEKKGLKGYDL